MTELILKDEVYRIVGAALEIYNEMGNGFLEAVYQECMEIELTHRGIPCEPQKDLRLSYKSQELRKKYRADMLVFDSIVVEIKASDRLIDQDQAQMINYLNATGMQVGILINFGSTHRLEWKRMVLTGQKRLLTSRSSSRNANAS